MPDSSGKAQSSSSMATPFERAERRGDLEQLQDDRLVGPSMAPLAMRNRRL
jgi:hypothetical protein